MTNDDAGKAEHKGQKSLWIRIIGEAAALRMKDPIPEGSICFASQRLRKELAREINTSLDVVLPVWKDKGWLIDGSKSMWIGKGRLRAVVIDPSRIKLSFKKVDDEEPEPGWNGHRH